MGKNKTRGTTGINFGPIFFLIYVNDLPKLASIGTKILLHTDDTNITVTSPNWENLEHKFIKYLGILITG